MDAPVRPPDWNQLRAFLYTAELGSLTAAARLLGLTQPTLGRQVAALERQLGVTLFERVGRSLATTATGQALLAHVRGMSQGADALQLAAAASTQDLQGVVSISASEIVAARLLPRVVQQLAARAPGLVVQVVATDDLSDLQRREADIAVRHVQPQQPELIGRRLRDASAGFYASRAWVRAHGHPRSAADALRCSFVGVDRGGRYLGYLQHHGLALAERNFSCYAEQGMAHWALVRAGMGIGAMMDELVADDADVVRVLEEVPPVRFPIWLVTHRGLRSTRRIRIVFDQLAQALAAPSA
jgi:DNA-binding transcriptional LysR family regulator